MNTWRPGASREVLQRRAAMLRQVRDFFDSREVLEVETPSISRFPTLDLHLESFSLETDLRPGRFYLITSPEYHMKRLLSAGVGSIYQICKAFRRDEAGRYHNPEFTLIEWYRVGWDHRQLMEEVEQLLDLLLKCGSAERISYREVFYRVLKIDPLTLTLEQFLNICSRKKVSPPEGLKHSDVPVDEWLSFLMGTFIESELGQERPVFVYDYPASQANLARLRADNPALASRFELYYRGVELANGFFELKDAEQQKRRFTQENALRKKSGKPELPMDTELIAALESGMPNCAGVALGFDRIVMLALDRESLDEVVGFSWDRC
ncbi:MAG: elongation factor P--(R)-beta-lysine ligase [Proteobacteria bacterium]|nr:elongation factor P--(R)-beta-lysine ligase [Pseudomonadota bacterium]